jgi:light-regulated signal transduction histidine kinase (bacteriophytochrome)
MRNMGTGASMSASLLCGGRLWGLISCHNETPHRPPFHVRAACEHVAQIMAVQIQALERARDVDQRMALRAIQVQLLAQIAEEGAMVDGLTKDSELLLSFAEADGAAVVFGGEVRRLGRTPTASQIDTIVHWLNHRPGLPLYATERVSADIPEAAHSTDVASGLLAIAISEKPRGYVLWFRPEVVRTVKWSGDPNNAKEFTPSDARIHPRKSFELWKEVVRQSAMPWSAPLRVAASELRAALLGVAQRSAAPAGSGTLHETEEGERRP